MASKLSNKIENLDAMQVEELREYLANVGSREGIGWARLSLIQYAENKLKSCELRLAGRIPEALKIERGLDEIYRRLPIDLKW